MYDCIHVIIWYILSIVHMTKITYNIASCNLPKLNSCSFDTMLFERLQRLDCK